ncbi:MAG TPA: ATP-binding protein, partial [Ktedonobacteraceae bacterium]|nr:ATP-binding protein [Ktedonobacteraceae bacterium]
NAFALFLRWGPLIVMIAYMLGTFGVMAVVPQNNASATYSTLTAVGIVFGAPAAILIGIIFTAFFVIAAVIYNVAFARILFVSALDHRLPTSLVRLNRNTAPSRAILVQTTIVTVIAIFTFFLGPLFYHDQGENLTFQVYDITQASTTIIWCISMLILFLDLPVLLYRFRELFAKRPSRQAQGFPPDAALPLPLLAPPWVLYLCSAIGGLASLLGIWVTLMLSWDTHLLSNTQWTIYVGVSVLVCLIIGLLGSAFPRLLSSLNEQTAAARENARLYSELSAAYAKLSELDQFKDAFLTTASHELRTPLTIMQGYLELLGDMQDIDPITRADFVNKARRACDELVLLQANIMDASRIKFDTNSLHCATISPKEVCTAVIDLFEPLILQEQRQVTVEVAPSLVVWADETRLKQILRNLFANALRYSPHETPISITAAVEQEQDKVRINVIDQGFGVPPAQHEAIFERFVRLERDMHGANRGSGLGLAITRQLVEAMHGTITVASTGIKGQGSTFSFTLPSCPAVFVPPPGVPDSSPREEPTL